MESLMVRNRAFTLVELLVVILIIGILIVLLVPNFTLLVERARRSAVKDNMYVVRSALEAYATDHQGVYPISYNRDNPNEVEETFTFWFPGGDPFGVDGEPHPGRLPINPYTGRRYYTDSRDIDYTTLYGALGPGENARKKGSDEDCPYVNFGGVPEFPGGIGIATHLSSEGLPDEYGIFGFGRDVAYPMYDLVANAEDPADPEYWVFIVLHN